MAIVTDGVDDAVISGTQDDIFKENSPESFYIASNFTVPAANSSRFFERSGGTGSQLFVVNSTGTLEFQNTGTVNLVVTTTTTVSSGVEYVIIFTYDGSGTKAGVHIYINNVEASYNIGNTDAVTIRDTSGGTTWYFNRSTGSRALAGVQHELAIFSRILNTDEISYLSTEGDNYILGQRMKPLNIQNCVRYYTFDDGSNGTSADGDLVTDKSTSSVPASGSDGANNTGCVWSQDTVFSYVKNRKNIPLSGSRVFSRQMQNV